MAAGSKSVEKFRGFSFQRSKSRGAWLWKWPGGESRRDHSERRPGSQSRRKRYRRESRRHGQHCEPYLRRERGKSSVHRQFRYAAIRRRWDTHSGHRGCVSLDCKSRWKSVLYRQSIRLPQLSTNSHGPQSLKFIRQCFQRGQCFFRAQF